MNKAGRGPLLWLETTAEDPGFGMTEHSLTDWVRILARIITRRRYVDRRFTSYQDEQIQVALGSTRPRQLDGDLLEQSSLRLPPAAVATRSANVAATRALTREP